jgi:hypothetical protein
MVLSKINTFLLIAVNCLERSRESPALLQGFSFMTGNIYFKHTIFACLVLLASLLFMPGLSGDYMFDDGPNVLDNAALRIPALTPDYLMEAAFSYPATGGGRWLSMLSFALNHYWTGMEPHGFKAVNLAIHVACAVAIYLFVWLLIGIDRSSSSPTPCLHARPWLWSSAIAVFWLITPINLSPALYVVQRMTSLCAFFSLISLSAYLLFRASLDKKAYILATVWCAVSLVTALFAVACKENGVLLPGYFLLLELFVLRRALGNNALNLVFFRLLATGILLVCIWILYLLLANPDWLSQSYRIRDFTPWERVLTQGRVLCFYLIQTFIPQNAMLGIYHDDWLISRSIGAPMSTLLSWAALFGLSVSAWFIRHRLPLVAFGVFFFLTGHSIEASFLSLELVHEHRNYLPSFGLVVALGSLVAELVPRELAKLAAVAGIGYIVLIVLVLHKRVEVWADLVEHAKHEVQNHPDSYRARYQWARVLLMTGIKTSDMSLVGRSYDEFKRLHDAVNNDVLALSALIYISDRYPEYRVDLETWVDAMVYRLSSNSVHPNAIGVLSKFLDVCRRHPELVDRIEKITASIEGNSQIPAHFIAQWLVELARFHAGAGNVKNAEQLLRLAIERAPS